MSDLADFKEQLAAELRDAEEDARQSRKWMIAYGVAVAIGVILFAFLSFRLTRNSDRILEETHRIESLQRQIDSFGLFNRQSGVSLPSAFPPKIKAFIDTKHASSDGNGAQDSLYEGLWHFLHERNGEAIRAFSDAISADPTMAEAFYFRGIVRYSSDYQNSSALRQALGDFDRAL